jgi:hypothetical protein
MAAPLRPPGVDDLPHYLDRDHGDVHQGDEQGLDLGVMA